ncbi:MAG: L-seryl-tRNA(Sec) selenium transferase [Deltaproteobacteria bacterium]|nr:L-seryl-tRNA(Sec) selenium transferase [Deltaproteobacteria bacterium]MBW2138018.1 L-seryl-tRNA(Sec) selenium transferase [Deltaproteobacteria bacterium]
MESDKKTYYRKIPSVDRLLNHPAVSDLTSKFPRNVIIKAINQVLDDLRSAIEADRGPIDPSRLDVNPLSERVVAKVKSLDRPSLCQVINATGVIVHTNLGRSLLAERVTKRLASLSSSYCNLEYDLGRGKRGSRYVHVEALLTDLTSAEAAMVVNNNAAAVLVALETLAKGREVIVSRGQLVEIGGSFRIPDVMRKSGARMVEVGTTNKTHLYDYEEKVGPETALLLKVHRSNFEIVGFTEEVEIPDLVSLGRRHGIPVMEDLGSGCLVDLSQYGIPKEPTAREALMQGIDIVTFSGDKLLGGPQAGIILGSKHLVEEIRKNQLSRALRIDKLTLLALEETLRIYRDEREALREIPTLRMISQGYRELRKKARRLVRMIGTEESRNLSMHLSQGFSRIGGGALPSQELPTCVLNLSPKEMSARDMEERLRSHDPPVIVRVERDTVLLDVRTIQDNELKVVAGAIGKLHAVK